MIRERKEKSRLQKEVEIMQKQVAEVDLAKKQDLQTA